MAAWKAGGEVGRHGDGIPLDAAAAAAVKESLAVKNLSGIRLDAAGLGIPFGDHSMGRSGLHRDRGFVRRIEVEDRRLHADRAAQSCLELRAIDMFHEAGELDRAIQRRPFHSLTVSADDRGEGAPFVSCEVGIDALKLRAAGRENKTENYEAENAEASGGCGHSWPSGTLL